MERIGTSASGHAPATVARRALWIPAVAVLVLTGHLALRTAPDAAAPATATATAPVAVAAAPQGDAGMRGDAPARAVDAAIAQHEALDPVGAGHDTPR